MVFDKIVEGGGRVAPEGSFDKKTWPKKYFKSIYVNPLLPNTKKVFFLKIFSSIELKHIMVFKVLFLYGWKEGVDIPNLMMSN